jgi:hypothetical protein
LLLSGLPPVSPVLVGIDAARDDRDLVFQDAAVDLAGALPPRFPCLGAGFTRNPERAMVRPAMVEPGLVTLAKIVGTLLFAMGLVPLVFLLSPGDTSEPHDDEAKH